MEVFTKLESTQSETAEPDLVDCAYCACGMYISETHDPEMCKYHHYRFVRRDKSGRRPKVVGSINGVVITSETILEAKRERQRTHLKDLLRDKANVVKPGFVWTFFNPAIFPYHGWWLYVITHKGSWCIDERHDRNNIALQVMRLYPCGLLPMTENLRAWKEEFARIYPKSTIKRPKYQGMVIASVTTDVYGSLLVINKYD